MPSDYLETYIERLRAVSLDDVAQVAKKYFLHDDVVIVVLTPGKETKASLESLGKVEEKEFQNAID